MAIKASNLLNPPPPWFSLRFGAAALRETKGFLRLAHELQGGQRAHCMGDNKEKKDVWGWKDIITDSSWVISLGLLALESSHSYSACPHQSWVSLSVSVLEDNHPDWCHGTVPKPCPALLAPSGLDLGELWADGSCEKGKYDPGVIWAKISLSKQQNKYIKPWTIMLYCAHSLIFHQTQLSVANVPEKKKNWCVKVSHGLSL